MKVTAEQLPIASVTADSRQVEKGSLFVAIKGTHSDGSAYALDAIEKGAVAVLTDNDDKLVLPASIRRWCGWIMRGWRLPSLRQRLYAAARRLSPP